MAHTCKATVIGFVLLGPLAIAAQANNLVSKANATPSTTSGKPVASSRPQRSLLLSVGRASQSSGQIGSTLQGLGYTGVSIDDDDDKNSWAVGYRHPVGQRFSVDIQYQRQGNTSPGVQATLPAGKTNAEAARDTAKAMPRRGEGASAIALYHHPVGSKLTLQAGLGAFAWESERKATVGNDTFISKSDGIDPILQLGVSYPITRNTRLEGHWQYIDMPDKAVNRIGMGIAYGF